MKRAQSIVYVPLIVLITVAIAIPAKKLPEKYNPHRVNGSLKPVTITIEWDDPDLPPKTQDEAKQRNFIKLVAENMEVTLTRGKKTRKITVAEYLELWKLMHKVKVWELDSNALTTPHPVGVPIRIFLLKMEGAGSKYLNVDVPNKKSRKHFLVINAILKLCSNYMLHLAG